MRYIYTDTTLKAFDESIAHWRRVIKCEHPFEVKIGNSSCALCTHFWKDHCRGCPISQATSERWCRSTPFGKAFDAKSAWLSAVGKGAAKTTILQHKRRFRREARKMLAFGVDLRAKLERGE